MLPANPNTHFLWISFGDNQIVNLENVLFQCVFASAQIRKFERGQMSKTDGEAMSVHNSKHAKKFEHIIVLFFCSSCAKNVAFSDAVLWPNDLDSTRSINLVKCSFERDISPKTKFSIYPSLSWGWAAQTAVMASSRNKSWICSRGSESSNNS